MRTRPAALFFLVATLLTSLLGCSDSSGGQVRGPLLTSVGDADDQMAAEVTGLLAYDGECLRLDVYPVVWPEGTTWEPSGVLTLPGGERVTPGERVTGGGGYLSVDAVGELFGDDVASGAERCLDDAQEIAVFNPGSEVSVAGSPHAGPRPHSNGLPRLGMTAL
jgi:hypothetical protein